jgi:hypothetical protein
MPVSLSRSILIGGLAVALLACGRPPTEPAVALVESYLERLTSDAPDRGWSLLHPVTQETHFNGDLNSYLERVTAHDWSAFGWKIVSAEEDDPGSYEVVIRIVGGQDPPTLIAELATFGQGAVSRGLTFYVKFNQLGGSGIYEVGP